VPHGVSTFALISGKTHTLSLSPTGARFLTG
jgi:hypothetical protein